MTLTTGPNADRPGNHDSGRNVLHSDAHVRWYSEDEFRYELTSQYEQYRKTHSPPPELLPRIQAFFEYRDP